MKGIISKLSDGARILGRKAGLKLTKASPGILLGGGIALVLVGVGLACTATPDVCDILDEGSERLKDIREGAEYERTVIKDSQNLDGNRKYEARCLRKVKLDTAGKIVAKYAPAASCLTLGLVSICASHGIMKKREATLLAAYNVLESGFRKYRERVLEDERLGPDDDYYFRTGCKSSDPLYISKDGSVTDEFIEEVDRRAAYLMEIEHPTDPHTFIFSKQTSKFWSDHPLSNLHVLRVALERAYARREAGDAVFMNECLDMLGMDPVPVGQLDGWMKTVDLGSIDWGIIELIDHYKETGEVPYGPIPIYFNCVPIWDKL